MNACFSTTGLMQRFQLLFVVLTYPFFAIQQADAAQAVTRVAPRTSAGTETIPLEPRAEPYALKAGSGKVNVRFSVRLTGKTKPPATVFLRRSDDRKNIAMNDQGRNGDLFARDGVYGANVTIDTSRLKPDTCLKYQAVVRLGRAEAVSSPLRLCVSAFPVRVAASTTARADVLPDGTKAVADEILIDAKPGAKSDAIRRLATDINARVVGSIPPLDMYQLKLSSPVSSSRLMELVTQLSARAEVKAASVNAIGGYAYTPTDPEFVNQHGLKLAIAHDAGTGANVWDSGAIGTGVTVTVLDTGLDKSHPDFGTPGDCQLAENDCGAANTDTVGHGTWVAGVVGAKTNNALGVAGIAYGSKIHSIIVVGGTAPTIAQMTQGFIDASGYPASVINASFDVLVSAFTNVTSLCASVNSAVLSGATPVAVVVNAADNYSSNSYYYPARCNVNEPAAPHLGQNEALTRKDLFITVANSTSGGSCGSVDQLHSTSNYGAWVDIAAPGCDIRTTAVGGGYISQTGTSFSAPMVSGAAAILKSCGATLAQIEPALKGSAIVSVPYPGGSAPRLDVYRALAQLDLAPTALGPASSSLNENNVPGATVATLTATDTDTCDKHTFTLVAGAGDTDNGAFTITGNQLTINGAADYETKTSYSIRVRVTDAFGKTFEQALTVNVNNLNDNPPVITSNGGGATATISVPENTTAVTTVIATDADNLGSLTYSKAGGADEAMFNIDSATGALSFAVPPDFEAPADADANNVYDVVVQASDGTFTGTQAIAVTVTNVNEAPVANNDTLAAIQNTPVTYTAAQLLGNDTDVDAGTTLAIASVTSGAGGTVVLNGDGTVTFTPNLDFIGPASFTYSATDGSLPSNVATVTVNVAAMPHAPVANDDTLAATEDISLTYTAAQLLGNDTDVDAGTTLTIASVTSGAGGAVVLNGDGTVTFTPNANFNGAANFTYRATDGGLLSNVATVTVNVGPVNDAPTGLPFISGTRTVGQTLTANTLTATFPNPIADADGLGTFSYQWLASGLPVGGNSDTYVLASADFGKYMNVCVSYTDGGGTLETLCSGADAVAVGDPHITTVDGLHYDFQSAGEFVALRGANDMEIQLRMAAVSTAPPLADPYTGLTSGVSVNTAVAARVGKHRVTYQPDTSPNAAGGTFVLRVDGVVATLPADGIDLGDGGRVMPQASGIQIDFPDQTTLTVNTSSWPFYGAWWLHVSVFHTSAYDGIMGARSKGSWLPRLSNGSALGAMPAALHDRYVGLYVKFADSWRVNKETSLFDYAEGTSTATFTNKAWPTEKGPYVAGNGPVAKPLERKAAQLACRDVVGKNEKADCVFDVMVMGHADLAKGHLLTQKMRTGLTAIIVNDDRGISRDKETVTFTATVARHAALTRTAVAGKGERGIPTGAVQFTLDGKMVGKPVKLDEKGQARLKVPRLAVGERKVAARYIPAKGSVFMPSSSREASRAIKAAVKLEKK